MKYNDILSRVNSQRNSGEINSKLFWYIGLIQAIELFSQKLNFDQVVYTCMDSINELLTVQKAAIYVHEGDKYILKKQKGYKSCASELDDSQQLRELPLFHAGLLYRDTSKKYFDSMLIEEMDVKMVVPLIIENSLFGFILIGNKIEGDYDEDNYVLAEAMMRLVNNALENYKKYLDIQKINSELDEKVFNLFAINQASKVLLSELDIYKLYSLAVDVFSELTQSAVTGFILYDRPSGALILKSYRNIFNVNQKTDMVARFNGHVQINPYKIIVNTDNEDDVEYLRSIFPNYDEMVEKLNAKYFVLLLKKQELYGVVTLGSSVTEREYKSSIFELIESLATSTYIAISNAELFDKVNEQKLLINKKFEKLVMLNSLLKNINSSESIDVMSQLVLKTLGIAFKVDKALIAAYDKEKDCFTIMNTLGFKTKKRKLMITKTWKRVFEGDTIFEGETKAAKNFIKGDFLEEIGEISGIIISPISLEGVDKIETFGVIIVFKYVDVLMTDEENRVIVQTISNHIAPIMASFNKLGEQARTLIPNYAERFRDDIKLAIEEAIKFNLDLEIINISFNNRFSFGQASHIQAIGKSYKKIYPVAYNNIFLISNIKNDGIEAEIKGMTALDAQIERYKLHKEFNSFEDFIKLF